MTARLAVTPDTLRGIFARRRRISRHNLKTVTPEAVSEYVTKAFALTPGRDRLEIVEVPQEENTTSMMLMQLKLQMMMQGESAELGREYLTLEIMYKHHEFLPEDQRF
ncbi:hypothetical protein [uncultured Rothia sp.]|uniref:hypothetical protein n=1 Tax=uncultured Rothia sp. TaxID=316088 RepID=UPI00260C68C4|nr:hypothetical protein [uncultured Rothia sp.]